MVAAEAARQANGCRIKARTPGRFFDDLGKVRLRLPGRLDISPLSSFAMQDARFPGSLYETDETRRLLVEPRPPSPSRCQVQLACGKRREAQLQAAIAPPPKKE